MLTIHGVPLSVHTRKAIVTAILKGLDYRFEVVIPVIPDNPPKNWSTLSPTGLIPVMQDGGFTLGNSTAICQYLEKKQPQPAVLPADTQEYARALWFDAYAGGTIFRNVVHPLFFQTVVNPNIRKMPTDGAVIDDVMGNAAPRVFGYLDGEVARTIPGRRYADARRHRRRLEPDRLPLPRLSAGCRQISKTVDVFSRDDCARCVPARARRRKAVRRADGTGQVVPVVSSHSGAFAKRASPESIRPVLMKGTDTMPLSPRQGLWIPGSAHPNSGLPEFGRS